VKMKRGEPSQFSGEDSEKPRKKKPGEKLEKKWKKATKYVYNPKKGSRLQLKTVIKIVVGKKGQTTEKRGGVFA